MRTGQLMFLNKISSFELHKILTNALKEQERDILDLQQEQMYAGLTDTGLPIQPDYAQFTIEKKKEKGQPYDRVTLKDTGNMYREQYVKFAREHFEITTRSRLRLSLQRKYNNGGGDIFGLTPSNKLLLGSILLPLIQESFKEYLLAKLIKNV